MDRFKEIGDQAENARFNVPAITAETWTRADGVARSDAGNELQFNWPHGAVTVRLARADLVGYATVDLMVLQAHLEAALSNVRRAVEADGR